MLAASPGQILNSEVGVTQDLSQKSLPEIATGVHRDGGSAAVIVPQDDVAPALADFAKTVLSEDRK